MNNIQNSLYGLFDDRGVSLSKEYKDCIEQYLVSDLSFTSEMMNGLARTIFQNKKMMAYYLLHNAIDEAKGAARLRMIAERYACLLYTSPSPRDRQKSRMPSSA